MMSNGDWTVPYLFRAVCVICIFLIFGAILNSVILKRDVLLLEKDHQTSLRISLLRSDYERKIADNRENYKRTCEKSVQEAVKRLKETAKLQERNSSAVLHSYYADILKNHSLSIKQVADEVEYLLKDIGDDTKKSTVEHILFRLKTIETQIADIGKVTDSKMTAR